MYSYYNSFKALLRCLISILIINHIGLKRVYTGHIGTNYARTVAISWGSNYIDLKPRKTKTICMKLIKLS
jgi:hypothetical protein